MNILQFHIGWTVILVILFIGIVIWAYNKSSDDRFNAAEQLPFDDDQLDHESIKSETGSLGNRHE